MKKTSLIALSFLLCACSPAQKTTPENPVITKDLIVKIEPTKEYVYADTLEKDAFKDLLKSNNRTESYELYFNTEPNASRVYDTQKITLNFNSEDAKKIQTALDTDAKNVQSCNEQTIASISNLDRTPVWCNLRLVHAAQSKDMISLVTTSLFFGGMHSFLTTNAYNFDIKNGNLLSSEQALEKAGFTMNSLLEYIKKDFAENPIDYLGKTVYRIYNDNEEKEHYEDYEYRIKKDNPLFVSDTEIIVLLSTYSGLDDTFNGGLEYRIKR